MVRRALLIGFVYHETRRQLFGSLVDLYRVYTFLVKHGYDDIHLLTDLSRDPPVMNYKQTILEGHVDATLLSFISKMQQKHQHHLIRNDGDLSNKISELLNDVEQCMIYITGHGEDLGFVCPTGIISWTKLQTAIFTPLHKRSQVIIFLDTCHAWHFQLPYTLLRERKYFSFIGTTFFPACHLVLLTTQGYQAAATSAGSLVTRSLFNLLEKGYDDYFILRDKVEKDLQVTDTLRSMHLQVAVYATYPTLYRLWDWFQGDNKKSITTYQEGLFLELF